MRGVVTQGTVHRVIVQTLFENHRIGLGLCSECFRFKKIYIHIIKIVRKLKALMD